MAKTFIFNFDGTGNAPNDAEEKETVLGIGEESGITNILKLHLLCGGHLSIQGQGWPNSEQNSFYYAGIGTYGSLLQRVWNTLFAPEGSDVKHIIKRALNDLSNSHFDPNRDTLLVTGFSRGAALARRFAKLVSDQFGEKDLTRPCIYVVAFDTVASLGKPDLSQRNRPRTSVVFENHTLAPHVAQALHLVALDEKREVFQPTLMNREARVTEVWFAGAHSNIGGGYQQDGLSDVTMQFSIDWIRALPLTLDIKSALAIDYASLIPSCHSYTICPTSIAIQPNPLCRNHQQDRWLLAHRITLSDRICCVLEQDKIAPTRTPIIHKAVITRTMHIPHYQPRSLSGVRYQVIDNTQQVHAVRDHQNHTLEV